jgi:cytidyltransferase-like protein
MKLQTITSKIANLNRLREIRQQNPNRTIVFCTGCYDILQSGHAVFFNQCKSFGDLLVVGIGRDAVVKQLKGDERPINPENNRLFLVAAMQDVDYVTLNGNNVQNAKIDFQEILDALCPNIFVLNDDDSAIEEKKQLCRLTNTTVQLVPRDVPPELQPTSTTKIFNQLNWGTPG